MKEADKPPFARHRAYYVAVKILVLAIAAFFAYRYLLGS